MLQGDFVESLPKLNGLERLEGGINLQLDLNEG